MTDDKKESTPFENLESSEIDSTTIVPKEIEIANTLDNQTVQPKQRKAKLSKSFDDMELERENKLKRTPSQKSVKSKDDLYIIEQEKSEKLKSLKTNEVKISDEFAKSLEQESIELKKESRIKRFLNKVKSVWNWTKSTRAFKGIKWLLDTKLAKNLAKVLFGSAIGRAVTIAFAIVTLAGASPPVGLAAATIALMAVTSEIIVDVIKTRKLRKLAQENDLLMQNRGDMDKQQYLLLLDPKLAKALENKLHVPNNHVPNGKGKYYHYVDPKVEMVFSASKFIVDNIQNAASLASDISAAISGNPVKILAAVKSGALSAVSMIGSGVAEKDSANLTTAFKININDELRKDDVAHYRNLRELREVAQKQHIQTATLAELMQDKDYFKLTDEQKQNKFDIYQQALTELMFDKNYNKLTDEQKRATLHTTVNKLEEKPNEKATEPETKEKNKSNNILTAAAKGTLSILKDLARTHDPFYQQPKVIRDYSPLTKAMEAAKKSAKEIVTPEVIAQLRKSKSVPNLSQEEGRFLHRKKLQRSNSIDNHNQHSM
ncbi:hypothetical protein [Candidatus Tisiphia endosymbiont of Micropterix aruncella]|uniref:hypothetical protein n=1 Tax=Candidatus Tisiphia endosymbiont of Micropterix aruncella TaxID=3066271 RepID=UPI003AA930A7